MIVTVAPAETIASLVCSCQMICSTHPYELASKNPHSNSSNLWLGHVLKTKSTHQGGYKDSYGFNR